MDVIKSILSTSLILAAGWVSAASGPHDWLERMNNAVHNASYEGRFVYQIGDQLDAMYLIHRVHKGKEKERLIVLNGPSREVIRNDKAVAAVQPDHKVIHAGTTYGGVSFTPLSLGSSEHLNKNYVFELLEGSRVAGRESVEIRIRPKDKLRYGYQLFLDDDSGLPLRSIMRGPEGDVISQMMFVDLQVGERVTTIEHDYSKLSHATGHTAPMKVMQSKAASAWRFLNVPPGYVMSVHRISDAVPKIEHFVFTDGLASVSVYAESAEEARFEGVSRLGATHAVSIYKDKYQVTAVGEAPVATLKQFLHNIAYSHD